MARRKKVEDKSLLDELDELNSEKDSDDVNDKDKDEKEHDETQEPTDDGGDDDLEVETKVPDEDERNIVDLFVAGDMEAVKHAIHKQAVAAVAKALNKDKAEESPKD